MAKTDIPCVFTNANMHTDVHMLFEGAIAEPSLRIEPRSDRKYIMAKRNPDSLTICSIKMALNDTLQAALLFCNLLS